MTLPTRSNEFGSLVRRSVNISFLAFFITHFDQSTPESRSIGCSVFWSVDQLEFAFSPLPNRVLDVIRGNGYIEASDLCPQFVKNFIACFFDNS